ncbi:MAG: hypothetical protein M1817_006597 [Caeruleum heppii]|nr:MAG: hypothetical protein M1817_006597 [Caeruleum heppii]
MTSSRSKNPTTWEDYQYGVSPRQGSMTSEQSHVHFDDTSPTTSTSHLAVPGIDGPHDGDSGGLRRRRSSLSMRIDTIRHAGGPNSIENFARSWQRAAGFYELSFGTEPQHPPNDVASDHGHFRRATEDHAPPQRSLLRAQLEREASYQDTRKDVEDAPEAGSSRIPDDPKQPDSPHSDDELLSVAPHLASPFGASLGTSYGTLANRINNASLRHAGRLFQEQQRAGSQEPDKEREPLLVKRVEREDGKLVAVVVGQSTLPQTIFNSVNVLIGIGLLALPMGLKYAGWLIGLIFLLLSAIVTSYTAKILAKCLDVDNSLITFADIAYVSFGQKARIATSILFSAELIAACVALLVLFADSLDALIPGWGPTEWKVVCGIALVPMVFVPLRVLSFSSILGIISCLGIVIIVFLDGLLKIHTPGSLREPAETHLFPRSWSTLPLSFGLLMSPWGGHSVFPNIYRDMRHPKKYQKGLAITYTFTFLLDLSMAVSGYLMYGEGVLDELTSNILLTKHFPHALSVCIVVFIAIIPLTKIPLNARPIISTVEILTGLDARTVSNGQALVGMSAWSRGLLKFAVRIGIIVLFVIVAILFPSFDRIMALLGSAMCFTICIILPLAFYLRLFGREISPQERILDWILIVICSIMACIGTVWACLPRDIIGVA